MADNYAKPRLDNPEPGSPGAENVPAGAAERR